MTRLSLRRIQSLGTIELQIKEIVEDAFEGQVLILKMELQELNKHLVGILEQEWDGIKNKMQLIAKKPFEVYTTAEWIMDRQLWYRGKKL